MSQESDRLINKTAAEDAHRIPLSILILILILVSLVTAIIALTVNVLITRQSDVSKAEQALAKVKVLDTHITRESELFTAALNKAINTIDASASPEAIGVHIRAVTQAKKVMIVAPYDKSLESETEAFDNTIVYQRGPDGAVATDFEYTIQTNEGKAISGVTDFEELDYVAGRPIKVGRLNGYVLVSKPVMIHALENMNARVVESIRCREQLPRGTHDLDTDPCSKYIYSADFLGDAPSLTVFVELEGYDCYTAGRVILTAPKQSEASRKWMAMKPYIFSMLASLPLGVLLGLVLIRKAEHDAKSIK